MRPDDQISGPPHEQTRAEHTRERDAVRLSLLLATTRADRHGVYAVRRPRPAPRPAHVFVVPVMRVDRSL